MSWIVDVYFLGISSSLASGIPVNLHHALLTLLYDSVALEGSCPE